MTTPVVSVVIPAYNSAWSIGDTLKSVLNQSLREIEVLVVNDGSTDALHETVARAAGGDRRVRIIDQENRGLAGARNAGIRQAVAPLVGLIDADDLWHPRFLERLHAALAADPDAPFAFAGSSRIDMANRLLGGAPWPRPPRHDLVGLFTVNSVGNGSAALFRRDRVLELGGFDETMRDRGLQGAEDWKLCLQLAARGTPARVAENLVGYRFVPGGMSQSDPARQMRAIRAVMDDIVREQGAVLAPHRANATTVMIGWLLPAFRRVEGFAAAWRLLAEAYLANPLWFRSAELRMLHRMKVHAILLGIGWRLVGGSPKHLSSLVEEGGARPFAFLDESIPALATAGRTRSAMAGRVEQGA